MNPDLLARRLATAFPAQVAPGVFAPDGDPPDLAFLLEGILPDDAIDADDPIGAIEPYADVSLLLGLFWDNAMLSSSLELHLISPYQSPEALVYLSSDFGNEPQVIARLATLDGPTVNVFVETLLASNGESFGTDVFVSFPTEIVNALPAHLSREAIARGFTWFAEKGDDGMLFEDSEDEAEDDDIASAALVERRLQMAYREEGTDI